MCLEVPCVSLSVSVEHAGVKQTSGAASLAAGARIGSGLIGQLAPAPAVLMLNNHFLHSTFYLHTGKILLHAMYTNTGDSAEVDGGPLRQKMKMRKY